MFTVEELVEKFSVARVSKSPAVFDLKRLQVLNGRYLRTTPDDEFAELLVEYLTATGYLDGKGEDAAELVRRTAPTVKRKLGTLAEYDDLAGWLFRPYVMEPEAWDVLAADVKHSVQVIGAGLGRLEQLEDFSVVAVREALSDQLHILGESARDFLEPQRIAITGTTVSTGVYESLALLGPEASFERYRATMARLAELWQTA